MSNIITTKIIVKRFIKVHGYLFDYSLVVYKDFNTNVIIICRTHGQFLQRGDTHIKSKGCPVCKPYNHPITKEEFVKKALIVHPGNKYDYTLSDYINSVTKIIITCLEHGDFLQEPRVHLEGKGCPACSYSKGEKAIIEYLLKFGYDYVAQKQYTKLVSETGYPLKYDFYIPKYNILIEFDGPQHKKHFKGWISKDNFDKIQYHDKLKNDFAKINGIQLIRITKIKEVNNTLTKYLF